MGSVLIKVALGIALLAILVLWRGREVQVTLQVGLAIAFTFVLFISLLIHIGRTYKPPETEDVHEEELEGDLAEGESKNEEAEAIIVEARPPQNSSRVKRESDT